MEEIQKQNRIGKNGAVSPLGDKTTLFSGLLLLLIGGAITIFDINIVLSCFMPESLGCLPLVLFGPGLWLLMIGGPIILITGIIMLVIWRKMKTKNIENSEKI